MSKRILITGATGAVGSSAAKALAKRGNVHLVLIGRDNTKLETLKRSIEGPSVTADTFIMDLSDSESVNHAIRMLKSTYQRIDALVNIAALYKSTKVLNSQKHEMMFATNHLGPFALTMGMLHHIQSTPSSKILTVSAPSSTRIDFTNLDAKKKFSAPTAFGATKMMNLLFAFYLAKKFKGTTHASIAFHPGLVRSDLLKESPAFVRRLFHLISSPPEKTGEAIAKIILEGDASQQNGKFFNKKLKEMKAAKPAYDELIQKKLFKVSEEMTAATPAPAPAA